MAGGYGGDGGTSFDIYHGRNTPSFILYADGQLLVDGGGDQYEQNYFERVLSPIETCSILNRIRDTGFLTARGSGANYPFDRIYADIEFPPDLPPLPWPASAPSISSLAAKADSRGDLELDGATGAEMKRLLELPGIARYVDQGIEYVLAGRQLLPHESRNYLSRVSLVNASIDDLPGCANRPDLAAATQAPGPSDAEWLLQQRLRVYGPGITLEEPPPQGNAVTTRHGWPVLKGQSGQDFGKAYRFTTNAEVSDLVDFYKGLGMPSTLRYRGMITDTYIYVPSQNESIQTLGSGRLLFVRIENGIEKAWVVIHIGSSSPSNEVAILEYDKMPFTTRDLANLRR